MIINFKLEFQSLNLKDGSFQLQIFVNFTQILSSRSTLCEIISFPRPSIRETVQTNLSPLIGSLRRFRSLLDPNERDHCCVPPRSKIGPRIVFALAFERTRRKETAGRFCKVSIEKVVFEVFRLSRDLWPRALCYRIEREQRRQPLFLFLSTLRLRLCASVEEKLSNRLSNNLFQFRLFRIYSDWIWIQFLGSWWIGFVCVCVGGERRWQLREKLREEKEGNIVEIYLNYSFNENATPRKTRYLKCFAFWN